MARTPKEQTWQPTADGQFVLYGVAGPAHNPDRFANGYLVCPIDRQRFTGLYEAHAVARVQKVSQSEEWPARGYPATARGTWETVEGEFVLSHNGREFWHGKVINNAEPVEPRKQEFVPLPEAAAA